MGCNMIELIIKNIKKRLIYIFLLGVIVAVGLAFEKGYNTQYVVKSGEIWNTKILTISNYNAFNRTTNDVDLSGDESFKYDKYMKAYPVVMKFINQTEVNFDYKNFDSNWDNYTELEKIKWFDKHIFINDFGSGIYEVCLHFTSADKKNSEYIEQVGDDFIDEYISFSENHLKQYNPKVKLIKADSMAFYPKVEVISKKDIVIKYGFVGFILGITIALTILIIRSVVTFYERH